MHDPVSPDGAISIDLDLVRALEASFALDAGSGLHVLSEDWFEQEAVEAFTAFVPMGIPISFVIGDLDRFRSVNDERGHAAGDDVLDSFRAAVAANARRHDVVLRGEGDSFKAILLGSSLAVAASWAEMTRLTIGDLRFRDLPDGLTASLGVALHDGVEHPHAMHRRALDAMLRAKRLGGDRVELAPPSSG